MNWQDIIFSIGSWIFIIALIPTVLSKDKPPLSTSLITGSVLAVFVFAYATLDLWMATFSTAGISITWFIIAIQRYLQTKTR